MTTRPPQRPRRNAMRRSVAEGVLYAGMVGLGEFWFVADAVRLDAGPLELSALVTLPQLCGALGAVAMLRALRRAPARRALATAAVALQALGLLVLAGVTAAGATSPWLLVAVACLHHGSGQAAGTAWASWFGDLVPPRLRGRWFGRRNQAVSATTFATMLAGGVVLHLLEPVAADAAGAGGGGYALCYLAAAALRLGCAPLLVGSWEPPFVPPADDDGVLRELRGPQAAAGRGVLFLSAGTLAAVCVAAPFFAPHMLETLRFSYPAYLGAQALQVATKVLALGAWGRLVDRKGPVAVYRIAALLVALVPLPWVVADRAWIVYAAQALSGVAWAGFEVAMLSLVFAARADRRRAVLLTAQSLANGAAQTVGGLAASGLATLSGDHAWAFAASALGRLVVALLAPLALAPLANVRVARSEVAARVVGWRAHSGVHRHPVPRGSDRR